METINQYLWNQYQTYLMTLFNEVELLLFRVKIESCSTFLGRRQETLAAQLLVVSTLKFLYYCFPLLKLEFSSISEVFWSWYGDSFTVVLSVSTVHERQEL